MGMVTALLDRIRQLFGLLLPVFSRAGDLATWGKGLRAVVMVLLLAGLLVLAYFLNPLIRIPDLLPGAPAWFKSIYLPLIVLLIVAMAWVSRWLYFLLNAEEQVNEFDDITKAWQAIKDKFYQANIRFKEQPLFLVLGHPTGCTEGAFFDTAQLSLEVRQTPSGDHPIHAYASRKAIYLTCPGASVLGRQVGYLGGQVRVQGDVSAPPGTQDDDQDKSIGVMTIRPEAGAAGRVADIVSAAREGGRAPGQLTTSERFRLRIQQRQANKAPTADRNAVELLTARLRYLCKLIRQERRPFCPINGVVVVVPVAATDSDKDASDTAVAVRTDLQTVRQNLQLFSPVFTLISDLDQLPGVPQFLPHFTDRERKSRFGKGFTLFPDLDPGELGASLEGLARFVGQSLFLSRIPKFFRTEALQTTRGEATQYADVLQDNIELFRLLAQCRERHKRLATLLTRGVVSADQGPPLFGGCYLAATGSSADRQAFIHGTMIRPADNLEDLIWTDAAVKEDANFSRWTWMGYTAVAVVTLLLVGGLAVMSVLGRKR